MVLNIDIRKHIIDLIPIMTLGGIFKVVIFPSWDNMTYTNPITVDPVKTALLFLGFSIVMAILYLWRELLNRHDAKKNKKQDPPIKKLLDFEIEMSEKELQGFYQRCPEQDEEPYLETKIKWLKWVRYRL